MNLKFKLKVLLVGLAVDGDIVQVFVRVDQDLDFLVLPGDHTRVALGTAGKEVEGREIDIEGRVLNGWDLEGGEEARVLVVHDGVDVVGGVEHAKLGFFFH